MRGKALMQNNRNSGLMTCESKDIFRQYDSSDSPGPEDDQDNRAVADGSPSASPSVVGPLDLHGRIVAAELIAIWRDISG